MALPQNLLRHSTELVATLLAFVVLAQADPPPNYDEQSLHDALRAADKANPSGRTSALLADRLAGLYDGEGRAEDAERLARRAVAVLEASDGAEADTTIRARQRLAVVDIHLARYARAGALLQRNLEIVTNRFGEDDKNVADAEADLGQLELVQHKSRDAERRFLRALEIFERNPKRNEVRIATTLNSLAVLAIASHKPAGARLYAERASEIIQNSKDVPAIARITNWDLLASIAAAEHRAAETNRYFTRALELAELTYGPDHPAVSMVLENYASALSSLGRSHEARPMRSRALTINSKISKENHLGVTVDIGSLVKQTAQ